jgi:hypothetical protein
MLTGLGNGNSVCLARHPATLPCRRIPEALLDPLPVAVCRMHSREEPQLSLNDHFYRLDHGNGVTVQGKSPTRTLAVTGTTSLLPNQRDCINLYREAQAVNLYRHSSKRQRWKIPPIKVQACPPLLALPHFVPWVAISR